MSKLTIKDNMKNDYVVKDVNRFKQHLLKYHCTDGEANNSVHEENGRYFSVSEKLLQQVEDFLK